jgi:gamma-glutamylcyclotransferase (GGCT)/AIG2-like uncharacterized protein YtfP
MEYLFVYGTLRKEYGHKMHKTIATYCTYISNGMVKGQLYRVSYYPALVLSQEETWVIGELYSIHNSQVLFKLLDEYEDYYPSDEAHSDYVRKQIEVKTTNGQYHWAWTYIYNLPIEELSLITSGDFMKQ